MASFDPIFLEFIGVVQVSDSLESWKPSFSFFSFSFLVISILGMKNGGL